MFLLKQTIAEWSSCGSTNTEWGPSCLGFCRRARSKAGRTPREAAEGELWEATDYTRFRRDHVISLVLHSNYGCGKAHIFVARSARQLIEPAAQDLEEMQVVLLTPQEVLAAFYAKEVVAFSGAAAVVLASNRPVQPFSGEAVSRDV